MRWPLAVERQEPANGAVGANITVYIPLIIMRPPNLKIKAERKFDADAGLTQGSVYENIIGFEGSGLTSDTIVAISTEWYDQDGSPLPEDLLGFTGRLARVASGHTLKPVSGSDENGNSLANFEIRPGSHLQLVRLPQAKIDNHHYYIHVAGDPPEGNPDFSETGAAADGPLQYRPKRYVPVQVPIYDEAATNNRKQVYHQAVESGATGLTPPEPVYRWVYRPEMQFSVFDLDRFDYVDEQGEAHDLLKPALDTVIIPSKFNFTYSLIEDSIPALDPFGPGRVIVFGFGENEVQGYFGENNTLVFENIDDLALLSSDDYLTIRLYQNGDDANVLWEYAFLGIDLDVDSDNDAGYAQYPFWQPSAEEDEIEAEPGSAGKIIEANDDDIDGDMVPNYADGYDKFDNEGSNAGGQFTPLVLQILEPIEVDNAVVRFKYSASNPDELIRTGDGTESNPYKYTAAPGKMRIWNIDGNKSRNKADVNQGGNYIAPEVAYKVSDLGVNDRRIKLYIEGVNAEVSSDDDFKIIAYSATIS